jgi:hypothetical protein
MWFLAALLLWPLAAQDVSKACAACHTDQFTDWQTHKHAGKSVTCDVCHGPSLPHRNAVGATAPDRVAAPDEVPQLCGTCHPSQRKEYEPSKHGKLVLARSKARAANCATCHGVHAPRDSVQMKRQCDRCHQSLPAVCQRNVNAAAGQLACVSCHSPHTLVRK